MAKKVPVTSVTPAIKTKAVSKAQQARTRALVMGIVTATPVGRGAKAVATAAKAAKTTKAAKAARTGMSTATGVKQPYQRAGMPLATGVKQSYQLRATASADKTAQIAKNSVKTKPAAKPVGNPVNQEKSIESMISSVSRGGLKTGGTLGKGRDHRVANSKKLKWEPNSRKVLDEIAAMKKTKTVKINSGVESKTADQARSNATKKSTKLVKPVAARVPARRPESNPANPPRGTVRIRSGNQRPAVLQKRAVPAKKK